MELQGRSVDGRCIYVVLYIVLWSAQALLIKQTVRNGETDRAAAEYPYEVVSMIVLVESFKLAVACVMYYLSTDHDWRGDKLSEPRILLEHIGDGVPLFIPAALYAAYNALSFLSLRLLEPGTIRVLINLRVLFSGVLLQWILGRKLARKQWLALSLLFAACVVEQFGSFRIEGGILALGLVALQGFCSSLAGIYFQWLLQRNLLNIWVKNIYLYSWSLIVYFIAICAIRPDLLTPARFFRNIDYRAAQIVVVAGLGGILTSVLLRKLNVIVKEYANFAEMIVVAIAQHILFGTPLRPTLFCAISLVSISLLMYNSPDGPVPQEANCSSLEGLRSQKAGFKKDNYYMPVSIKE